MIGYVHNYDLLKACIEDILSTIKPVEDDRKKRLCAIKELANSIYSVGPLREMTDRGDNAAHTLAILVLCTLWSQRNDHIFQHREKAAEAPFLYLVDDCNLWTLAGAKALRRIVALANRNAAVKPFGSLISNLYAKSGDLDVSLDLWNGSRIPIRKKKKQNALRELMKALQIRGVASYMEFIPTARVPILKYLINHFGISCDVSINNYPGQIKSRILYWIGTIDERFGDMVLLVKEWAKAQNINDPKNGTLNSYSLCLLVIFHFQTCELAILPPLKEIFYGKAAEELVLHDENHVDDICMANIERFLRQNMGHRNQSSLSFLLASFFHKFFNIWSLSTKVISTYTGQFEEIQNNPSWMANSYSLFVEDPFERPDNASRAVGAEELERIGQAFNYVSYRFTSGALADRDELLSLLCTPPVESILAAVRSNHYTKTPPSHQLYSPVAASLFDDQHHQRAGGSIGSISSSQGYAAGRQMAQPDQYKQPQAYNAERMTAGQYQSINRPQVNQLRRWEYSPIPAFWHYEV